MRHFTIIEPHFLNTAKSSRLVWVDTIWPFIHIRKGKLDSKPPVPVTVHDAQRDLNEITTDAMEELAKAFAEKRPVRTKFHNPWK